MLAMSTLICRSTRISKSDHSRVVKSSGLSQTDSQTPQPKGGEQTQLLGPGSVQAPDLLDRHEQHDDGLDDIRHGVRVKGRLHGHAASLRRMVPEQVERAALEDGQAEECDPPGDDAGPDDIGGGSEPAAGKDAQVQTKNGDLDECHRCRIDALKCHEKLEDALDRIGRKIPFVLAQSRANH